MNDGLLSGHLLSVVGSAFGRTMLLLALTLVIVVVIAIPVGCLCAAMRGSVVDYGLRIGTYSRRAVPVFIVAILFQEGFGRIAGGWGTGWFPAVGWAGQCPDGQGIDPHNFQCPAAGHGLTHVAEVIYHLAAPGARPRARVHRPPRRATCATPCRRSRRPVRHGCARQGPDRNEPWSASRPEERLVAFVPAIVSDFGLLFGGALAVDWIFQLGGMGTLLIDSLKLNAEGFAPVDTYALMLPWCSPAA